MTILSTGNTKNLNLSTYKCLREKEKQNIIQQEHKKEIMKLLKKGQISVISRCCWNKR
jgi:hypothetical protein